MSKVFDEITATIADISRRIDALDCAMDEPGAAVLQRVRDAAQQHSSIGGKVVNLFDRRPPLDRIQTLDAPPAQKEPIMTATLEPAQRDHEAVRALISHWLRRVTDTDPCGYPDSPDLVAAEAVSKALLEAREANASADMTFGAGVEFGISAALAVINNAIDPSVCWLLEKAVEQANSDLRDITKTARVDMEVRGSAK